MQRMPGERTLVRVYIGSWLSCSRIVPFDSLIHEVRAIDKELSQMFEYFPQPFLPDAVRLVNAVRAYNGRGNPTRSPIM
jgi:hypothetical protein